MVKDLRSQFKEDQYTTNITLRKTILTELQGYYTLLLEFIGWWHLGEQRTDLR